MVLAVPVAVRFLQRGNRELSRNMSSYLSLAAIAEADLLAEHTEAITLSVLAGKLFIHSFIYFWSFFTLLTRLNGLVFVSGCQAGNMGYAVLYQGSWGHCVSVSVRLSLLDVNEFTFRKRPCYGREEHMVPLYFTTVAGYADGE